MFRGETNYAIPTAAPQVQVEPVIVQNFKEKDITGSHDYDVAIRAYLTGKTEGKFGRYQVKGDELWFIRKRLKTNAKRTTYNKDILARKINGVFIGNSSVIRRMPSGNTSQRGQTAGQIRLGQLIPMVPFSVFKDAKLSIDAFRLIDKGHEEDLDVGDRNSKGERVLRHFTGAMLFEVEGVSYLFDLDRNDVALKQFNAFLSRLPGNPKTIEDAYASLKPQEVYEAERFMKEPCPRHGEWFFIPVKGNFKPSSAKLQQRSWFSDVRRAVLQSKGNRPHYVEKMCEEGYVTGRVEHGGREHKDIVLKGWYKPVPNTAVESFKISGEID